MVIVRPTTAVPRDARLGLFWSSSRSPALKFGASSALHPPTPSASTASTAMVRLIESILANLSLISVVSLVFMVGPSIRT